MSCYIFAGFHSVRRAQAAVMRSPQRKRVMWRASMLMLIRYSNDKAADLLLM